jgi:hypothetical protein
VDERIIVRDNGLDVAAGPAMSACQFVLVRDAHVE